MSKIEVNTVEPQCGTTLTLGGSGDTVALASGASQTGFGRTGTVDWDTSIHTGTVTAATGKGYFVNTTSGGITVNLPAAAVGSIVAVSDYASTSASNNILIEPNGSDKINGVNDGYSMSTNGLAVTLVYADATRGWKSVTGSDADATGLAPAWVTATGGTPCAGATCGDYKIHTFTGPGTLVVSCGGNPLGNDKIDYLVVGGGGSGGAYVSSFPGSAGGGGAGGFRESVPSPAAWTASPLASPAGAVPVTATPYPIVVGGGGAAVGPGVPGQGNKGNDSSFSTITSTGGGYGGNFPGSPGNCGGPGGSGGGGGGTGGPATVGGTGNDPPTSPAQGKDGGDAVPAPAAPDYGTGGGGGATEEGVDGTTTAGGRGGAGATTCISTSPVAYAGGGGGSTCGGGGTVGAASPCGTGGAGSKTPGAAGSGTTNRGGGGGGHGAVSGEISGAGGSGVVIIRYKFQ